MANKFDHYIYFDSGVECISAKTQGIIEVLKAEMLETRKVTRWNSRYSEHLKLIVLNLFKAFSIDQSLYVGYSRDKSAYTALRKSRYSTVKLAFDSMTRMVDILQELEYMEGKKGYSFKDTKKSRISKMKATQKLMLLCFGQRLNPRLTDYSRNSEEETIILRDKDATGKKIAIEYEDNTETRKMRENLRIINGTIYRHFIGINVADETLDQIHRAILGIQETGEDLDTGDVAAGNFQEKTKTWKQDKKQQVSYLDFSQNTLKRIFSNGSFEQGGRFYRGWWQPVPSRFRPYICIDDERTIEIDFSGIHINLLYLMENLPIPTDDVYTIEGLPKRSRSLLKVALQILLNSKSKTSGLRAIKHNFPKNFDPELFEEVTHEQIIEAFLIKHEAIAKYFYSGIGITLQYRESVTAEEILFNLAAKDIVALPIHDSFIVKKRHEQDLVQAMNEAVYKHYGSFLNLKSDLTAHQIDSEFLRYEVMLDSQDIPPEEEYDQGRGISRNRSNYLARKELWYREGAV